MVCNIWFKLNGKDMHKTCTLKHGFVALAFSFYWIDHDKKVVSVDTVL